MTKFWLFFTLLLSFAFGNDYQALLNQAKKGNPDAQFKVGYLLYMKEDYHLALEWFKLSAEQGNSDAAFNLGAMYQRVPAIGLNEKEAFYWFNQSAKKDNPYAAYQLGIMYSEGIGVKKSHQLAKSWYKKACDLGYLVGCSE